MVQVRMLHQVSQSKCVDINRWLIRSDVEMLKLVRIVYVCFKMLNSLV